MKVKIFANKTSSGLERVMNEFFQDQKITIRHIHTIPEGEHAWNTVILFYEEGDMYKTHKA